MFAGRLEIGFGEPLHIREESLSAPRSNACRLLYVSDIHLRRNRSPHLSQQVIDSVRRSNPDAILLGGDLVDSSSELPALSALVERLQEFARVFAIGGNHDEAVGIDQVRAAVVTGGGEWIHHGVAQIANRDRSIVVAGPDARELPKADVRILCGHNPRIWKTSKHLEFDLVLAGHLHGCQIVAFEYRDRLFPGAVFYPYCFLNHQSNSTRLIVSRGVSDLIPIRWRCPREVVLCHV